MAQSPPDGPVPSIPESRGHALQVARELLSIIESWAWSNAESPDQGTTEEAYAGVGRLCMLIQQYLAVAQKP